jgi:hypothetical protein
MSESLVQTLLIVGSVLLIGVAVKVYLSKPSLATRTPKKSHPSDNDDDDDDNGDESSTSTTSTTTTMATANGNDLKFRSLRPGSAAFDLPANKRDAHQKIAEIYTTKPLKQTAVFIDLPRLAKRIDVYRNGEPLFVDGESASALTALATVVKLVAQQFETPERYTAIATCCDDIARERENGEISVTIGNLFLNTIGEQSKTATIFKAIHQGTFIVTLLTNQRCQLFTFVRVGIVMPLSFALKAYTRLLSKDIKTRDGWRVRINIDPTHNVATVTHIRQEESFGSEPFEQFKIELTTQLTLNVEKATPLQTVSTTLAPIVVGAENGLAEQVKSELNALNRYSACQL